MFDRGLKATQKKAIFERSEEICLESIRIHFTVVSKDSKQGSFQMLMDSGKNLPCRKSKGQLKFRVPDRGVKENTICSMCGKKESDEDGGDTMVPELMKISHFFHIFLTLRIRQ